MSPAGVFAIMRDDRCQRGCWAGAPMRAGWSRPACWLSPRPNYWMSLMNLQISPWQVVWPRVCMIMGLSLIFAPLNVAAYKYMPVASARRRGGPVQLCCATKGAASARRWPKPCKSGASNSICCGWANISIHSIPNTRAFFRQMQGAVCATDRRSGVGQTNGPANAGQPARAASLVAGLFRRVLVPGRARGGFDRCWCCS